MSPGCISLLHYATGPNFPQVQRLQNCRGLLLCTGESLQTCCTWGCPQEPMHCCHLVLKFAVPRKLNWLIAEFSRRRFWKTTIFLTIPQGILDVLFTFQCEMTRKESCPTLSHLWQAGLWQTQIKNFNETSAVGNPAAWQGIDLLISIWPIFEDLNIADAVLGSGDVKMSKMFIQSLLNLYRHCVMVITLCKFTYQQDKSITKSLYGVKWGQW